MFVVALVALNLATAIMTSRYYPLPRSIAVDVGNDRAFFLNRADGSTFVIKGGFEAPSESRLIRPPMPPIWWFWSPVLAGATITLMALVIAARRPRMPAARGAVVMLLLVLTTVGLRWWWVLDGGDLPLGSLRLGMTRPEVRDIVGPPTPEGSTDDSWLITRYGSLYWLEVEFDRDGRLDAHPPNSHLRRHHPAYRRDWFR